MTSTNVFTGIVQEKKSSRVLHPPGGGQTDVLGLIPCDEPKERKINHRNFSSIMEGTDQMMEKPEKPIIIEEKAKPTVVEEKAPVETAEKAEKPQAADPAPPQQRTRVPPGGFSSGGFW